MEKINNQKRACSSGSGSKVILLTEEEQGDIIFIFTGKWLRIQPRAIGPWNLSEKGGLQIFVSRHLYCVNRYLWCVCAVCVLMERWCGGWRTEVMFMTDWVPGTESAAVHTLIHFMLTAYLQGGFHLDNFCFGRAIVAGGTLVPWPGIKPAPPALRGGVLATGLPGNSLVNFKDEEIEAWGGYLLTTAI